MNRSFSLLAVALCLSLPSLADAQRIKIPRRHDNPPGPALSPVEAVEKMRVPVGFSASA